MPPPAAAAAAAATTEAVKVVVRCRPLSEREVQDGRQQVVDADAHNGTITVCVLRFVVLVGCALSALCARCGVEATSAHAFPNQTTRITYVDAHRLQLRAPRGGGGGGGGGGEPPHTFAFDQVYDGASAQAELFGASAAPIVDAVLQGYNGGAVLCGYVWW
jgi:hypothetical protein